MIDGLLQDWPQKIHRLLDVGLHMKAKNCLRCNYNNSIRTISRYFFEKLVVSNRYIITPDLNLRTIISI